MTRVRSTPLAELPVDKRTPRKLNLPPQQSAAKPGAQQTSINRRRVASTPLRKATGVSPSPTKPGTGQTLSKQRPKMSRRAASHTTTSSANERVVTWKKSVSADSSPAKVARSPKEAKPDQPAKALTKPPATLGAHGKGQNSNAPKADWKPPVTNGDARRAVSGPARMNGEPTSEVNDNSSGQPSESHPKRPAQQQNKSQVNSIVRKLDGSADSTDSRSLADRRRVGAGTAQDGFGIKRAGAPAKSVADTTETGSSEGLEERRQPVKLKRKVPG